MRQEVFPIKVYCADTDCGGIVYYAVYMRWMEMGRCDFFERLGARLPTGDDTEPFMVVAQANLNYKKPSKFGDLLNMVVWVSEVTALSFKFHYQFQRLEPDSSASVLVEAQTLVLFVNSKDFRLLSIPRPTLALLEAASV